MCQKLGFDEADQFADRIVLIARGRIVADGTTHQIRSLTNVRTISATVDDPTVAERVADQPGVVDARLADGRLVVRSNDSDRIAGLLLTEHRARDLLITAPSLDDAFLQLTAGEQR